MKIKNIIKISSKIMRQKSQKLPIVHIEALFVFLVTYRRLPMTDRAELKTEPGAAKNIRRSIMEIIVIFLILLLLLLRATNEKRDD